MSPVTAWISRRISYIGLFLLVMCCVMLINQQSPNNNESNQSSQQQHLHQSNTAKEGGKWVQMEHCSCQRYIQVNNNNSNDNNAIPYNDTTCSTDAYERGSGQKVIGFSFYGDINTDYSKKKGYFEGMLNWTYSLLFILCRGQWNLSSCTRWGKIAKTMTYSSLPSLGFTVIHLPLSVLK